MAQYIDKSALVAEIEKIRRIEVTNNDVAYNGALDEIRYFLDNLEVKKMDFEEELKHYCNDYYNCDYPKQIEEGSCSEVMPHIVSAAKHFFDLGVKVAQKVDIVMDE